MGEWNVAYSKEASHSLQRWDLSLMLEALVLSYHVSFSNSALFSLFPAPENVTSKFSGGINAKHNKSSAFSCVLFHTIKWNGGSQSVFLGAFTYNPHNFFKKNAF